MSIHDFHSKLMSGKEEGKLFEGLRRIKSIGAPALSETSMGWTYWTEGTSSAGEAPPPPGWAVWEEEGGSPQMSRA